MTLALFRKRHVILVLLAAALFDAEARGQGLPVAGRIALSLSASSATPPVSSNFTVDLAINMASASGTCAETNGTIPMTLGAYVLGIRYDGTKLRFVSAARCPTTHAQITDPNCMARTSDPSSAVVKCSGMTSAAPEHPQGGPLCVARLTFTNLAATGAQGAILQTVHSPAPLGIATDYFKLPDACGGPVTFPAGSISDDSISVSAN